VHAAGPQGMSLAAGDAFRDGSSYGASANKRQGRFVHCTISLRKRLVDSRLHETVDGLFTVTKPR
jgi:hypothetical protein